MISFLFILFSLSSLNLINKETHHLPNGYILFSEKIHMLSESKMYLSGKTNISDYACDCTTLNKQLIIESRLIEQALYFKNAKLEIESLKINCKNRLYNSNMRKSLEAQKYPTIIIDLLKAWKTNTSEMILGSEWFDVESDALVTIKDKALIQNVKAKALQIGPSKYRIRGSHVLYMKDYNIKVPEIMFGLITIADKIDFNFDLYFEVLPDSKTELKSLDSNLK